MWLEVTQDIAQLQALDSVAFCYQKAEFHICSPAFSPQRIPSTLWPLFIILQFRISNISSLFLSIYFLLIRSYLHCFSLPLFSSNSCSSNCCNISQTFALILPSFPYVCSQAGDSLSSHNLADIRVTWYLQCCRLVFHKQTIDTQQYVQNALQMYPLTAPGLKSPVLCNAIILRLCSSNIVGISCLYCGSYANVPLMLR